MAITQPGGAGTIIYLYDDTNNTNHAAAPGPHTWAEIAAAFPADFISGGTNVPSYRSKVNVQIGDAGVGTAATNLTDATDATVTFDNGFTLAMRASQFSSWFLTLGTKLGTGNRASGINGGTVNLGAATTLRGTIKLYGGTVRQTAGALTWNHGLLGFSVGEAVNWMFKSTSGAVAPFVMGAAGNLIDNLYNVDFSHSTANQMMSNFFVTAAERITFGGVTPLAFLQSGSVNVQMKDSAAFGSPSNADFRWAGPGATDWTFVRPRYTGSAPKFSATTAFAAIQDPNTAAHEYWLYDIKLVSGIGGVGVPGIPVKLTDSVGNVQVSTTTDANGQISFGSGAIANAVIVADHYVTAANVYTIRHRSPFLAEFNLPSMAGYNASYPTQRYYFYWPGYASITTSSGSFEDVGDVIALLPAGGAPTGWVERSVP